MIKQLSNVRRERFILKNDLAYLAFVRSKRYRKKLRNSDRQILLFKRDVYNSFKAGRKAEELRFNTIGVKIVHLQNFNIALEIVESRKKVI